MSSKGFLVTVALLVILSAGSVAAQDRPVSTIIPPIDPGHIVGEVQDQGAETAQQVGDLVDEATDSGGGADGDQPGNGAGDGSGSSSGLADGLIAALLSPVGLATLGILGLAGTLGAGVLLATRYVDPKQALENPQRSMLYGCIKGHPGVNLKQLSEDFDMKTSTVLWHMRKLEGAELVRSQKANGLRVFYPVEGGVAAKNLGAAVAALSNRNAADILDYITIHPGVSQKGMVNALAINAGTVRWHLRKLKEMGLMAELSQGRLSSYYPTELGIKALHQTLGLSADAKPVPELVAEAAVVPPS